MADLHWGFAVSHRIQGNLVPLWGDEEIAARLRSLISDYRPLEILWLGDSLHTLAGKVPAERFLAEPETPPTTILSGNHDRRWAGATHPSVVRGGYFFHHGDRTMEVAAGLTEVIGHFHPAVAWWDGAGGNIKIPALIEGPARLILPAFSPWAAGTPWNGVLGPDESIWAVSARRVFRFAQAR